MCSYFLSLPLLNSDQKKFQLKKIRVTELEETTRLQTFYRQTTFKYFNFFTILPALRPLNGCYNLHLRLIVNIVTNLQVKNLFSMLCWMVKLKTMLLQLWSSLSSAHLKMSLLLLWWPMVVAMMEFLLDAGTKRCY